LRQAISVILGGLLVAFSVVGCLGTAVTPGRLDVTITLRQACAGASVAEIRTVINAVEQDRLKDATQQETQAFYDLECSLNAATQSACVTCVTAIISQVYGP
jgi:hypothetical protein